MRLLIATLYFVLSLGAVTMIYPFFIMLGASVESQYDIASYSLIPGYLRNSSELFGKYAEDKYAGDINAINSAYRTTAIALTDVKPPSHLNEADAHDWDQFVINLPLRYKQAGFGGDIGAYSPSLLLDRYHDFLTRKFHGDIQKLDREYLEEDTSVLTVFPPFEQPTKHNWAPVRGVKTDDWEKFETTLPPHFFRVVGADPIYEQWLKEDAYANLDALNKAWGTSYADFLDIPLTVRPVGNAVQRQDWATFVRTKLPFRQIVVAATATAPYQAFLKGRYKGSIAAYNKAYAAKATGWEQIALPDPETMPPTGPPLLDWMDFLKQPAPLASLTADTAEIRWRTWAQGHYHLSDSVAATYPMPIQQADYAYILSHKASLRWDFITRNYRLVMQFIALHGNGVSVTIIYCALAVLTAVVVNPMCAYALSRYSLSYANAIILFVLATTAFPAEVAMIPNFLLLKQMNLLNTFWALVLPGAANGFSIFLLKGFFDSLPKELYEAGTLDGAGEMKMFTAITFPLSKPIFAVIALGAFTSAYGAFMFALYICQSRSMWTLMVWLYEMQASGAPQYVMMAALALAAIPTLLVFIFAQNTIMKGIILPSYK